MDSPSSRISNPVLLASLRALSRLTESRGFSPFHDTARRIYTGVFTRQLESSMRKEPGLNEITLIPHHSAADGGDFNVFVSDIDYSLVVPEPFDAATTLRCIEFYARWRARLPFLGELEMYTRREWAMRKELERSHRPILQLIWHLRKFVWQTAELDSAPSAYHRDKARRSIIRILERAFPGAPKGRATPGPELGMLLAERLDQLFPEWDGGPSPGADAKLSAISHYLGWRVGTAAAGDALELVLPHRELVLACALLPDSTMCFPALTEDIDRARRDPAIKASYAAIVAFELLICRSVARTKMAHAATEARTRNREWMSRLRRELRIFRPDLSAVFESLADPP